MAFLGIFREKSREQSVESKEDMLKRKRNIEEALAKISCILDQIKEKRPGDLSYDDEYLVRERQKDILERKLKELQKKLPKKAE